MSSTLAAPSGYASDTTHHPALGRAQAALWLGAAAAVALAMISLFVTTSSDDQFHYTGDYFLTADGIPYVVALLVLLPALRSLQRGRDGRLGRAGIALASAGSVVLGGIFVYGLVVASGGSLGPTYVIASLATILGVGLFAAGSWRAGLLPRWLIPAWVVAWLVGSMLPIARPGPLLLAAVYVAMALLLPRRVGGRTSA
jgi:hypothetical protein